MDVDCYVTISLNFHSRESSIAYWYSDIHVAIDKENCGHVASNPQSPDFMHSIS